MHAHEHWHEQPHVHEHVQVLQEHWHGDEPHSHAQLQSHVHEHWQTHVQSSHVQEHGAEQLHEHAGAFGPPDWTTAPAGAPPDPVPPPSTGVSGSRNFPLVTSFTRNTPPTLKMPSPAPAALRRNSRRSRSSCSALRFAASALLPRCPWFPCRGPCAPP